MIGTTPVLMLVCTIALSVPLVFASISLAPFLILLLSRLSAFLAIMTSNQIKSNKIIGARVLRGQIKSGSIRLRERLRGHHQLQPTPQL